MTVHGIGSRLVRPLAAGAIVASVAAAMVFGVTREGSRDSSATPAPSAAPALAKSAAPSAPQRTARTADEESYLRALWPIHGDVQRSAMRLSLGQIFYKTQDLARDDLKARVDEALAAFGAAEARLRAITPPPSLRGDHETYAAAVRLFKESAVELGRMFVDGRDDHMLAAYPGSQEASDRIREVGGRFWPHEFPPH